MVRRRSEPGIVTGRPWREFVIETNDGIIASAGIVEGMLAAEARTSTVILSALLALVVGTIATVAARFSEAGFMRDAALEAVDETRTLIARAPEKEREDLVAIYVEKGLRPELAEQVATELSDQDALGAHIEDELELEEDDFRSPWLTAAISGAAFAVGASLPLALAILIPYDSRVWVTVLAVMLALLLTSAIGASLSHVSFWRTALRNVGVGLATLSLAALVGSTFDL